ncbi:MAG: 50S ribosomal protein L6 [Candidatus Omnitrophica bacterium]|nr:50S ribosomal protein L6 [Candidatus Omnitrophota bacterium]MDD5670916.1 50S ribosomal protein L6 [Candidatus Omnitrophota bacterium]
MSRIGKKPVVLPSNVKASFAGQTMTIQGPKGKLEQLIHPRMKVKIESGQIIIERPTSINTDRALHGLMRSLIQNMVVGVTEGYKKELEIEGVGYKAAVKGRVLNLALGFTHPIDYHIPDGIEILCPKPTLITITGMDKQKVGQAAAEIRSYHKPEPYKGKGIHYIGEYIRRKQGKTVG